MMLGWETMIWGNTMQDYAMAFGYFVILLVAFWILQKVVLVRLKLMSERTATRIDDALIRLVEKIRPPVYGTLALWVALWSLVLSTLVGRVVNGVGTAVLVYQVIVALQVVVDYIIKRRLIKAQSVEDKETGQDQRNIESALSVVNTVTKVVVWSVGLLFILSNFGLNVTSLVASLGIGGIAVALAAQNILGDLFSSLAIYLDKPFAIGDFIIVGDTMGTVKHIGIKTTRIKALAGEEIVLPNQELTNARVRNFKLMETRRVAFTIGVEYQTPKEKVKKIVQLLKEAIESTDKTEFNRAHFKSFGDSALIFEVVYHVTDSDYDLYMDVQQAINLNILELFEREEIVIAYPTHTVLVRNND